jgi:hypothetical protein
MTITFCGGGKNLVRSPPLQRRDKEIRRVGIAMKFYREGVDPLPSSAVNVSTISNSAPSQSILHKRTRSIASAFSVDGRSTASTWTLPDHRRPNCLAN